MATPEPSHAPHLSPQITRPFEGTTEGADQPPGENRQVVLLGLEVKGGEIPSEH